MAVRDDDDEQMSTGRDTSVKAAAAAAVSARAARIVASRSGLAEDGLATAQADLTTASPPDNGSPQAEFHDIRLGTDWAIVPSQPVSERIRGWGAIVGAVALHGLVIAISAANPSDDRIGAGGADLESISVDIVPLSKLVKVQNAPPVRTVGSVTARPDPRPGDGDDSPDAISEAKSVEASAAAKSAPASQKRADVEADIEEPRTNPAELVLAKRKAQSDGEAGVAAKTPADTRAVLPKADTVPVAEDPTKERPDTPSAAATPSTQSVASTDGGAVATRTEQSERAGSTGAELAAGRRAVAYGAAVVKALADLQKHLQRLNDRRDIRSRGKVELMLTINGEGRPELIQVMRSSGDSGLDKLAVADVTDFRFPPAPADLPIGLRTYRLPITYR